MTGYLVGNTFETDEVRFFDLNKWVLQMLNYNRIDLNEGNDHANCKEYIVLH